jgi:ATP-dependent helicase/nuclease subunit A
MTSSRAIDQASRATIREALLENLLVEAGAGSGKTQMLAERMAAGVAAGVYQVEHMAAVTFTRKAASELRGRFHLALESALAAARTPVPGQPPDTARIARLEAVLSNLERFFAGTIHSFCARLLRERPVESGVAPGFSELDEVQDLELRQRVWRDFITSARAAGDPEMLALLESDIKPKDLDDAFGKVCDNDDVEFPPGDADRPDAAEAGRALTDFWAALQALMPASIDPASTCKTQKAAVTFRGQWRVLQRRADQPAVMATLLRSWDREPGIVQKWWADTTAEKKRINAAVLALLEDFRANVVAPYLAQWQQYVYRLSIGLLTRARHLARAERRRLNVLNYGDLLNLTAGVLRTNGEVRRALQQKYRYLLVDEFQDTDPVQAEICFWLAEDGAASTPAATPSGEAPDWRQVPLRPGALFVVGDPKQSIYRFRRADIDIYNVVRQRFSEPGVGQVVPLTRNFRSAQALCQWANTVFQTRFPADPTAYAPRFASLDADETTTRAGDVATLTHACDQTEVHLHDAAAIARYIRTEVQAGRRRFSDFLILTRKRKHVSDYADALEALDIPVEVSGAGAFGESPEVRALTVLLRALADPHDTVALIAVLRGPLYGVSDRELFAFRQSGGWFSVFHEGDSGATPGGPVAAALGALRRYFRYTRVLPAAAALDRVLEDTGYLALAATTPGGVDAGDVVHAVDRVRQVVEDGGSLADAADALDADREATSEVESLPLEPGRTDVVRLMNLHKAKGLEAHVVFLADPLGGVKPRVDVHIERTGLAARGWLKLVRKSDTSWAESLIGEHADWDAHEAAEAPYLQAEEVRLLYVAATRARELLVVSRWADKPTDGPWGGLAASLAAARELPVPAAVSVPHPSPLECGSAAQAVAEQARVQAHAGVVQPSWTAASVTAEAHHIARMTRAVEAEADDPSKVVVANTPSHRADAGQAWGTLVHGLLEHAMRHRTATRDDLRRLAVWLTVEEPQLRPVIDEALDTVRAVAAGAFWAEAKAAAECHEEAPFAVRSEGEGVPAVLTGVIDLVHRTAEGWRVVDYKTDRDGAASLDAKYAGQVAEYARAWQEFAPEPVATELVSARRNGQSSEES